MPWSGSGLFTRIYNWATEEATGDPNDIITGAKMDQQEVNVKDGLENCLTRDGQNSPSANLPMNAKKHTGVAEGTSRSQYATMAQLADGIDYYVAGGTADAMTITASPTVTAYVDGMTFKIKVVGSNTVTNPTLNVNSVGAATLKDANGNALGIAALTTNSIHTAIYDGANFRIQSFMYVLGEPLVSPVGIGIDIRGFMNGVTRNFIDGFLHSHGTDTDHDIDVLAGVCADSTNAVRISVGALTKQIDAAWSAGNNAGGYGSGSALANDTWYRFFAIMHADGTGDYGWDTSASATNLLSASGYTYFRQIAWHKTTGTGIIVGYQQNADDSTYIVWSSGFGFADVDLNITTPITASTDYAVIGPPNTMFDFVIEGISTVDAAKYLTVGETSQDLDNPNLSSHTLAVHMESFSGTRVASNRILVGLDSDSKLRIRASSAADWSIRSYTHGYRYNRGKQ